ncbi:hypothetical protein [Maribacter sp. Asnod2-G09]|uniref:hypothetical protein n=1 Tax=Maribacter sp. Asnod2-G09 TaxID=3160577 RepID=UPI00386902F8
MSYRGLKWLKFNFVMHPKELKEVFNNLNYFIAITNRRISEDYQIRDKASIFTDYKAYYEKIISGEEWSKEDWKLDIYTQITDNPELVNYEVFEIEEENEIKRYKRAIQLEPVINVAPFNLTVQNEKLSVAFHDSTRNSSLGIQFSYPKEILYLKTNEVMLTEQLSTFQLYSELIKQIKKKCKKAKAMKEGKVLRPNFWISELAIAEVNSNVNLKSNDIILV